MDRPRTLTLDLPAWIDDHLAASTPEPDPRAQMRWVLGLADRNVAEATGGPFAAAVVDRTTGELLAAGVNRVEPLGAAIAHAEVMAIALAGAAAGTWDLANHGDYALVSSTEPCAMCLGAVQWSGVRELRIGARDADARAVGFDEGVKPDRWAERFAEAGIYVVADLEREAAAAVLRRYAEGGGTIYNGATATAVNTGGVS